MPGEAQYLGRFQQGEELPLTLQCIDSTFVPADPLYEPVATIYRDGAPPTLIETRYLAADLRGVQDGLFRLPLFLGQVYSTAGRYLVIFRWQDAGFNAHSMVASFTLLPGGSPDGAVIALKYVERPDSRYLLFQTDGGRLVRGRNPR